MKAKEDHFKEVNALLEAAQFSNASEKMKSWPKVWLNQFLQTYPENYELLKHEDFDVFWAGRRTNLDSRFSFVKQKNLSDMDVVLGYVFYLMANRAKANDDEKQYIEYLGMALKHHSIHAAQTFLHNLMVKKSSDKTKEMEMMAAVLYNWKNLAARYGTPGYLLLANGYLHLLQWGSEQKKSDLYDNASFCLWQNLILAELYEAESEASLQNAYFGKGLALSNSFNLHTIQDMKEKIAPLIVDNTTRARAESKARHLFETSDNYKVGLWLESRQRARRSEVESFHSPKMSL
ncbi:DUF5630 domain-containing protein [Legionella israelensis]|uniref:Ankyrin repeat protein n=1 Tax=Legionella israelensis TaxID=454 RepID=A0A0W0WQE5_9GAMM|nr:DUF5630 domain-containing protein [Legionella israelensis]KTD34542.1 Ankyrin repeat protein [Legionella israelensis]QBS09227.1 hypothetical protein E4T55_04795 [Legionella israelensis]SCX98716.1 hypothetical protein SAMN02746069_00900 [Legionella israelensis DSM 19235]STX58971.1 Ankyrin repeat protein [Legionella israelensis]